MKMLLLLLGLTSVAVAFGQAKLQENSHAVPLCHLLAEAAKYDRTVVTVEGVYIKMPHGSVLTAPGCPLSPRPDVNLRSAPGFHQRDHIMKVLWSLTEKREPVEVVLEGTLHVAKMEQGFGQGVEPYEIEVTRYLSAEPYSDKGSQTTPHTTGSP